MMIGQFRVSLMIVVLLSTGVTALGQAHKVKWLSSSIPNREQIVVGQRCQLWCWAASFEMIALSYGIQWPQEKAVQAVYQSTPCKGSGAQDNYLKGINGFYTRTDGKTIELNAKAVSWESVDQVELVRSIQNSHPFILIVDPNTGSYKHDLVVTGLSWSELTNGTDIRIWSLQAIDPYFTYGATKYRTIYLYGTDWDMVGVVLVSGSLAEEKKTAP